MIIEHSTVGDLVAALASYPPDTPLIIEADGVFCYDPRLLITKGWQGIELVGQEELEKYVIIVIGG